MLFPDGHRESDEAAWTKEADKCTVLHKPEQFSKVSHSTSPTFSLLFVSLRATAQKALNHAA